MLNFVMAGKEKWVFLLALGGLLLNWPLMVVFDGVLPHYLFGVWAFLIVAAGVLSASGGRDDKGGKG